MRLLHTADLHLGKRMNDVNLYEDQENILLQITGIAKEEAVDAVIIAGDVYQKTSPSEEAVFLFDRFISDLVKDGRKVLVISGNHDSGKRISYLSSLIKTSGVYVSEEFTGTTQQVTLTDEYGEVVFHLLPFVKSSRIRRLYPEAAIASENEAFFEIISRSEPDFDKRNVLICHGLVTGAEVSDSEEIMIGGLHGMDAGLFENFDYTALGHIHKPQSFGKKVRYAGAPLKYSFSEAGFEKSVTIVDLKEKGSCEIKKVPLVPIHEVREVKGTLSEVMGMDYSEDYVRVVITDEVVAPDARVTVSTVFPNMMKFAVSNSKTKTDLNVDAEEDISGKSIKDLFCDFFRLQNNDMLPSDEELALFDEVVRKVEEERYEAD